MPRQELFHRLPQMLSTTLFLHACGLAALLLNVIALCSRCEVALRRQSVAAGVLWAMNNFMLGADSAAALSAVSAGRSATSAATLAASRVARRNACLAFLAVTVGAAAVEWHGALSAATLAASLMSCYAMFYLRGTALRLVMLGTSFAWMASAWALGSWEQMAANVLTAASSAYGAWRCQEKST